MVITSGSCLCLAVQEKSPLFALQLGILGLPSVVHTSADSVKSKEQ